MTKASIGVKPPSCSNLVYASAYSCIREKFWRGCAIKSFGLIFEGVRKMMILNSSIVGFRKEGWVSDLKVYNYAQ